MKRLTLLLAILAGAIQAFGSANASGKLTNPDTTGAVPGYAQFTLYNCGGNFPQVAGSAILSTQQFALNTDGTWSGTLYRNDEITCNGTASTWWRLQYFVSGRQIGPSRDFVCSQASCVFDGAGGLTPITTYPAPPAPAQPLTGAESVVCSFPTPASTWSCTENMGTQQVVAEFFDLNSKQIFPDTAQATDVNTFVGTFLQPQAGFMRVVNVGNWTPSVSFPNYIIGNPTSDQSITGDHALTLGGSLSAKRMFGCSVVGGPGFTSIAAAVTDAGTNGCIIVMPSYAGTDTYPFATASIPMFDFRSGTFMFGGNSFYITNILRAGPSVDASSRSIPLGNDILVDCRGAADCIQQAEISKTTATTSVGGAGTQNIAVGTTANFYTGATITVDRWTVNAETIAVGNWSIVNGTTLNATFTKAHTQPYQVDQWGALDSKGWIWRFWDQDSASLLFQILESRSGSNKGFVWQDGNGNSFLSDEPADFIPRWFGKSGSGVIVYGSNGGTGTSGNFQIRNNHTDETTLLFIDSAGDILAGTAGSQTLGTASNPFGSVFIGGAATNNVRLTATTTAARTQTLQDATGTVTLTIGTGNVTTAGTAIAAGTTQSQTGITVSGALTSDSCTANIPAALPATWQTGIQFRCDVTSANTVTVNLLNPTAGSITPAATQVNVRVTR